MEILALYYTFALVFIGVLASLAISISGEVYEMDECLKNRKDFINCIFMYQVAVKMLLESYGINIAGIIILEIITTLSVWFLNVFIFIILCVLLILKLICYLFWICFRKRGEST